MFAKFRLHLIVLGFGTGRPPNSRVGKVHMGRHGAGVRRSVGLGVGEVVCGARRRDAAVGRRGPAQV